MSDLPELRTDLPEAESPAAEYVLGVGDADTRLRAEQRLRRDAAFAAEVAYWEQRFGPLAERIEPVAPPPELWHQVEARVASARRNPTGAPLKPRLSERVGFWRGLAIGSLTAAAASIATLAVIVKQPQPATPDPLIARLDQTSGTAAFVLRIDREHARVLAVPTASHDVGAHSAELWLVPADGTPRPIGLLDPANPVSITIPAELLPHAHPDVELRVSLEPVGGSPSGQLTGPVIAQGKLTRL